MTLHDFTPPPTDPEHAPTKAPINNKNDIERIINKRPIDYAWEYKRFRRSPDPSLDPYKNI